MRQREVNSLQMSVVIPTIGRPSLYECLRAINHQREDLEVIVAHDRWSQESQLEIQSRFPHVIVIAGPGRGPAANRNTGARVASGEWLLFVDDDCVPDADWIGAMKKGMISLGCDVIEGRTTCREGLPGPSWHAPINEDGGFLWSCNFAIRKAVFDAVGGFDERFPHAHMEDCDLRERLLLHGAGIAFAKHAVVNHPPRCLPGPFALADSHRSSYFYFLLRRERRPGTKVLISILKHRRQALADRGGIGERIGFFFRSVVEFWITAISLPFWACQTPREPQRWSAQLSAARRANSK